MPAPRRGAYRHVRRVGRYRSQFEADVAAALESAGVPFEHEAEKIYWADGARMRYYVPDFRFSNGLLVETKGRFTAEDRRRHLMIREQHPKLDIRFVFQSPNNKLYRGSKTTYAMWCDKNGFKWAAGVVPATWVRRRKPRKPS